MLTGNTWLLNKHAIPVGEEAITLSYGVFVGCEREFAARKGGDQHKQAGLGQVKIRQHSSGAAELKPWRYEEPGFASLRAQAALQKSRFNGSHAGGADAKEAFGPAHSFTVAVRQFVRFFVQRDI